MKRTPLPVDLGLALILTFLGAIAAWALMAGLPLIGIDDAAITRSYAENIAQGSGYVYNVGGERVEGSTTFLWVSILTLLYSLSKTPEILIIVLCFGFTTITVLLILRLTRLICDCLNCDPRPAIWTLSVFLLASPGYFMWSIWTMMEFGLWSMLLIWLVFCLSRIAEEATPSSTKLGVCLAAPLLTITRPEGVMLAIGLIGLATILAPRIWRTASIAFVGSLSAFATVTIFRLSYFGQPFPNTFYAKVSSDRLQDLTDGLKYLFDFLLSSPFAEIYLAMWVAAGIWALGNLRTKRAGSRAILIATATVVGMLSVYAVLGGDHFALWRFYQPIAPLLPVILAIGMAQLFAIYQRADPITSLQLGRVAALAGMASVLITGWLHYYQTRFDVRKEYTLVTQGLEFGTYLNGVSPNPSIGVGPAGGIALAYDGQIYDLLGLNWTEMAHANPIKTGMRNHASFDTDTFWKHAPEVVSTFNAPCHGKVEPSWQLRDGAFDGLFSEPRFRSAYVPVTFEDNGSCWPGFAKSEWIATVSGNTSITVHDWIPLPGSE